MPARLTLPTSVVSVGGTAGGALARLREPKVLAVARAGLATLALCAACATGCAGRGHAPGTIVFEGDRSGREALYAVRPDGSGLTKLLDLPQGRTSSGAERARRCASAPSNSPASPFSGSPSYSALRGSPDFRAGQKRGRPTPRMLQHFG
jgi:hypothetical protein